MEPSGIKRRGRSLTKRGRYGIKMSIDADGNVKQHSVSILAI